MEAADIDSLRAASFQRDGYACVPWPALRQWGRERRLRPAEAEAAALEAGLVPSRYLRTVQVYGLAGQTAFLRSALLVAGCGGLGGLTAELLARAGVGTLHLVDGDAFADSDLNRQMACTEKDLGKNKARALAGRLALVNSAVRIFPHPFMLDEHNAPQLLAGCDAALDCLDAIPPRRFLHRAAQKLRIPVAYAAVEAQQGEAALFGPTEYPMLELWDSMPPGAEPPPPATSGPTAAALAALQASLVLRLLAGHGADSPPRLFSLDLEFMQGQSIALPTRSQAG